MARNGKLDDIYDLTQGLPDFVREDPTIPAPKDDPDPWPYDPADAVMTRESRNAERKARVAVMYCKRYSQYQIAQRLNISQPRVSQIIRELRQAWETSAIFNVNAQRLEELRRIDAAEQEYWEAWRRSQEPREISDSLEKQKSGRGKRGQDLDEKQIEGRVRTHARDGNPAFMQGVLQCIQMRIKLLGLDKVPEIDLETKSREMARELGLDEDVAVRMAVDVVKDYEVQSGAPL